MKAIAVTAARGAVWLCCFSWLSGCAFWSASQSLHCDGAALAQLEVAYTDWPAWLDRSSSGAQSERWVERLIYNLDVHHGRLMASSVGQEAPAVALANAKTAIAAQRAAIYNPYEPLNNVERELFKSEARYYITQLVGWLDSQGCVGSPLPIVTLGVDAG